MRRRGLVRGEAASLRSCLLSFESHLDDARSTASHAGWRQNWSAWPVKGVIGVSAGVASELWTIRERGVVPSDDLTEEMRQLLKKEKAADSMDSSSSISMVPGEGVEPSRACAQRFLRPLSMP